MLIKYRETSGKQNAKISIVVLFYQFIGETIIANIIHLKSIL